MSSESEEIEQSQQQLNRPLKYTVSRRLHLEGRWKEIEPVRDELMREARKVMKLPKEEAQDWAYAELDRRYPPIEPSDMKPGDNTKSSSEAEPTQANGFARTRGESSVVGLNEIPADWPTPPPNARLADEIQWVQANRLRMVRESEGVTAVDLSQSLAPPPSYAALGWLETSIRAYAKYCEIAAKATQSIEDGREETRRERMKIDQIRDLLAQMLETEE